MAGEQVVMSTVFVAGLLSFFAPCILPLLPVYVGILMGDAQNRKTFKIGKLTIDVIKIIRTLSFVGGLSTSFIILGFGAGAIGSLISSRWFLILAGLVVVILGIHQTGLIEISVLERQRKLELKGSRRKDVLGTYLLGFTFSFGWTPCIGPILGAVLGISASGGQATYGAWLMLIYAIGLAMPFLIISIFSDLLLVKMKVLNKHMGKIKVIGGILIIIMGLLLMTDNLNLITVFFKSL
jgi:cytochrome c-type biogenesis protein